MRTYLLNFSPGEADWSLYQHVFHSEDPSISPLMILSGKNDAVLDCVEMLHSHLLQEGRIRPEYNLIIYRCFHPRESIPEDINDRLRDVLCQERMFAVQILSELRAHLFIKDLAPRHVLFILGEACDHGAGRESRESIANLKTLQKTFWDCEMYPALAAWQNGTVRKPFSDQLPDRTVDAIKGLFHDSVPDSFTDERHIADAYNLFTRIYTDDLVFNDAAMKEYCLIQYSFIEQKTSSIQNRRPLFQTLLYSYAFASEIDPVERDWKYHQNHVQIKDLLVSEATCLPDVDFDEGLASLLSNKADAMSKLSVILSQSQVGILSQADVDLEKELSGVSLKDKIKDFYAIPPFKTCQGAKQKLEIPQKPWRRFSLFPVSKLNTIKESLCRLRQEGVEWDQALTEMVWNLNEWYNNNKVCELNKCHKPLEMKEKWNSNALRRLLEQIRTKKEETELNLFQDQIRTDVPKRIDLELNQCIDNIEKRVSAYKKTRPLLLLFLLVPVLFSGIYALILRADWFSDPVRIAMIMVLFYCLIASIWSLVFKRRQLHFSRLVRQANQITENFQVSWKGVFSSLDRFMNLLTELIPRIMSLQKNEDAVLTRLHAVELTECQEKWHSKHLLDQRNAYYSIMSALQLQRKDIYGNTQPDGFSIEQGHSGNSFVYGFSKDEIFALFVPGRGKNT